MITKLGRVTWNRLRGTICGTLWGTIYSITTHQHNMGHQLGHTTGHHLGHLTRNHSEHTSRGTIRGTLHGHWGHHDHRIHFGRHCLGKNLTFKVNDIASLGHMCTMLHNVQCAPRKRKDQLTHPQKQNQMYWTQNSQCVPSVFVLFAFVWVVGFWTANTGQYYSGCETHGTCDPCWFCSLIYGQLVAVSMDNPH